MSSEHLIDASGRKEIHRVLTTHNHLQGALAELQNKLGLSMPELEPALAFLDLLQVPRAAVYQYLSESLRDLLNTSIQAASPDTLETLLRSAFRFIAVPDLKIIPISIIRAMRKIPEVYLKALADKRLRAIFIEFPLSVRRQILESSPAFFLEEIEPVLHSLVDIKDIEAGKLSTGFGVLCDTVSESDKLFVVICDWLSSKVLADGELAWASMLRQMLIMIDGRGKKMKQYGKLHELARNLEECVINEFFNLQMTVGILRAIITAQLSREGSGRLGVRSGAEAVAPPLIVKQQAKAAPEPARGRPPVAAKTAAPTAAQVSTIDPVSSITGPDLAALLQRAHRVLVQCDYEKLFRDPVNDIIAPGYSTVIQHPMDLSTMKLQIPCYKSFAAFENDILLMCENCNKYNGKGSLLGIYADDYLKAWRCKRGSVLKGTLAKIKAGSIAPSTSYSGAPTRNTVRLKTASDMPPDKKEPLVSSLPRAKFIEIMEEAWDALSQLDETGVFASPVTDEIAPQYSKVVKYPMDMSTIQTKIFKYRSFREFDADVTLMIENCHLYNGREGYYGKLASEILNEWQKVASNAYIKCSETCPDIEVGGPSEIEDDTSIDMSDGDEDGEGSVASVMSGNKDSVNHNDTDVVSPKKRTMGSSGESDLKRQRKVERPKAETTSRSDVLCSSVTKTIVPSGASQQKLHIDDFTSNTVSAVTAGGELQSMKCSGTLRWAMVLFYDPLIQAILVSRLAATLIKITSDKLNKLPCDDATCRLLLQLCQLPACREPVLPHVNLHLLRCQIPLMVRQAFTSQGVTDASGYDVFTAFDNDFTGFDEAKIVSLMKTLQNHFSKRLNSSQQLLTNKNK